MSLNMDDPRVRKTRRGLQEAFVRLILQRGYDSISIQDIAVEAETARVTFYRHYRDKEELLTDCLNTLYDDLVLKTEQVSRSALLSGYSPLQVLYEHIEAHDNLYRILFSSRGSQTVLERLRHYMATQVAGNIRTFYLQDEPPIPIDILAQHTTSAQLGLAVWWLDHQKPYPARYMALASTWLTLKGILAALGLPNTDLPMPGSP